MNEYIKDYLIFIIMFNFALAFVGATGIFPVQADIAGFGVYDDIQTRIENLQSKFTNASNSFEYMIVVASLIINGVALLFDFIIMICAGLPLVLLASGVPPVYVGLLVTPVLIMIFYEIVVLMSRSG